MTSTGNAVGMERAEGARNAQKDPRIEARERLEALASMTMGDPTPLDPYERCTFADLRTILSALSEAEGELDRMREALNATSARNRTLARKLRGRVARAALSPTRRDGE